MICDYVLDLIYTKYSYIYNMTCIIEIVQFGKTIVK